MQHSSGKLIRRLTLAAVAAGLAACNGTMPPAPTPPATQQPPPPIVHAVNTPPTIKSISVPVTRAEVDQDVTVTADVEDAETAVDQLQYAWSASAGAFTGAGRVVTWRLAKGSAATPVDVTMTLVVTERYQDVDDTGKPVTRENRVTKDSATPIRVNDSVAELSKIGVRFLVDYFGNSNVSPEACLVDFWDGCRGKQDELSDIQNNRATLTQLFADAHVSSITFNDSKTEAEMWVACTFRSRDKKTGVEGGVTGDCYLSAVYQQGRWWLCDSNFCHGHQIAGTPSEFRPSFLYCGGK